MQLASPFPALNQPAAYIVLPEYHYFIVSGDKSLSFLQGQLTCDVNQLNATSAIFGAYLNIKGRVVSTIRLFKLANQLLLQLPASLSELVITRLQRVAQLSRVTLVKCSDIATAGIVGIKPPPLKDICSIRLTAADQFLMIGAQPHLQVYLNSLNLPICSDAAWTYGLIQNKLVEINEKTTEQYTPHELDLPAHGAVSFTKGCYVGQEIVARMAYLGKLKQHLQQLESASPVSCAINAILLNTTKQPVGNILATCTRENHQYALAVLRDDAHGEILTIGIP